ncbi:putative nucleic acid-binding protein [Dyadobacter sp. BE34]|uniref:Nucleic acid-binding protein n=1 Tax=Dyadobacter fermentans TaxID=94254 RepID=A0ABU1R4J7_9BACT|nr:MULTISPECIES: PIN domain-containing protein [Dyadobacter]MDR6807505.1 putative nucleic acid-binding protein [Dyadobacter fermentans]MDR7045246.1 putative nucleic acid-binding protein [Dyadobacter sp. BE242]MDR7199559.1 putative nucleic acid-binding protein [Dyadobacter sp. BE34]MDR7217982.1 putative nucleic acid-binding protein [Dyadobacter sp. BE31]MDR7265450.1 putative nucleic acid-binding protein [Dyadobacter sp. BE32]
MKSIFPEQFPITEDEARDLWGKAIFAVDTNILIHLYRYSDAAKDELLDALQAYKDRLWVPNWVAKEFIDQRLDRISDHIRAYTKADKDLKDILQSFKNDRHPFLPEDLQSEFDEIVGRVTSTLTQSSKEHEAKLMNDEILDRINDLVGDSVGSEYDQETLDKIAIEGEERFKNKIPPGYKDKGKNDPTKPLEKYGDLIIWKQLIDKAKETTTPIIFICDDKKEDWILEKHGNKIGPLPALRKEFTDLTKQQFHLYNADRFVHYHNTLTGKPVNEEIQAEFRKVQEETNIDSKDKFTFLRTWLYSSRGEKDPIIEIVGNDDTDDYVWEFFAGGSTPLLESHSSFPNRDACEANLRFVQDIATSPENIRIIQMGSGYELSVFHQHYGPICQSLREFSTKEEAFESKLIIADKFKTAAIAYRHL